MCRDGTKRLHFILLSWERGSYKRISEHPFVHVQLWFLLYSHFRSTGLSCSAVYSTANFFAQRREVVAEYVQSPLAHPILPCSLSYTTSISRIVASAKHKITTTETIITMKHAWCTTSFRNWNQYVRQVNSHLQLWSSRFDQRQIHWGCPSTQCYFPVTNIQTRVSFYDLLHSTVYS
jgi:hypothetical protein